MADKTQKEKLFAQCSCGSGKKYGECCGRNEPCSCGSGKKAGECCFKAAK
ncbi:MAG: SEC-C metal-binding domain-containing protein [Deltaproteobacteria bacterium]|nr:SEC-C metal-binding domain-containing protein [Deltaproteobacteria bacterium]